MYEKQRGFEYPYAKIIIGSNYLELIDRVLSARLNQIRESIQDIAPHNDQGSTSLPFSKEELRTSQLSQNLLTLAEYIRNGHLYMSNDWIEEALQQVFLSLFGNCQSSDYMLPVGFFETELGQLINDVYFYKYGPENWMAAKQAYTTLEITRTSLYDYAKQGKLMTIYVGGELRFLRADIEAWKAQREQRRNRSTS
jgi:hypothetical protein